MALHKTPTYAMLADMRDRAMLAENQLATVTEQRDEARQETVRTREFMDYGFAKAQEELTAATAQRDRMAEALRKCREDSVCYQERMEVLGYVHAAKESKANSDRADAALQSLTPNEL